MILIDVPQVAYKTWSLEYRVYDKDGKRDFSAEWDTERDLQRTLSAFPYSKNNDHVR